MPMLAPTNVTTFRPKAKQTLSDLLEPSRDCDEGLARVIRAFERSGIRVVDENEFMGDASTREDEGTLSALTSVHEHLSPPFVSEYLTRPLRTEAEARAQSGKAHSVFETILSVWRP